MLTIYSLLIGLYGLLVRIAAVFNPKAAALISGRKNQNERIKSIISDWPAKNRIWIHAASYGEFEMAKPLLAYLDERIDNIKWIVSFHSPSGFLQNEIDADNLLKIYLPLDLRSKQNDLVALLKPQAVIFIKYEFWFNLMDVLYSQGIPYFFSSMHLNSGSYLLRGWSGFLRKHIKNSQKILAHNPESVAILEDNDFDNVIHFGDSRIDQVLNNIEGAKHINWHNQNWHTVAFGSIGKEEAAMVLEFIDKHADINIILAPHDIDRHSLDKIISNLTEPYSLLSNERLNPKTRVLIVDTMGDLKYLYASAHVAYVGGGFTKGPHNVLEPLVFGNRIICGPNIHKFPMAQYLASVGMLEVIEKKMHLAKAINNSISQKDPTRFKQIEIFLEENKSKLDLLLKELNKIGID